MFAIDGCKIPSNASKEWSGTHAELTRKKAKLERASQRIVERHQALDGKVDDCTSGMEGRYDFVFVVTGEDESAITNKLLSKRP